MRKAKVERETRETKIWVEVNLDGRGKADISSGSGFFDHILDALARHSGMDLTVKCDGDTEVDFHHSAEDTGIVLGKAFHEALGEKKGIQRYANVRLPMDEALVSADLDISGRAYLVFNAEFKGFRVGDFDTDLVEEFFRAFVDAAKITLHINLVYGRNDHHIIEAMFKAVAVAIKRAVSIDEKNKDSIPSTKGLL